MPVSIPQRMECSPVESLDNSERIELCDIIFLIAFFQNNESGLTEVYI